MAEPQEYILAPGVTVYRYCWGATVEGRVDDLLACGIVEPEWIASGAARDRRGRTVRTIGLRCGGMFVSTVVVAKTGIVQARFYRAGREPYSYRRGRVGELRQDDGRQKVAWDECAWQPDQFLVGAFGLAAKVAPAVGSFLPLAGEDERRYRWRKALSDAMRAKWAEPGYREAWSRARQARRRT